MKRGRPTLNDQKKIIEIILPYYEDGVEAITASQKTGLNYKTILKYYKIRDREIFEINNNNFLMRIKITKERNILMLDNEIISLNKERKIIQSQIDHALQTNNIIMYEKLSRLKLKLTDQLIGIMSAKTNLIGVPTADTIIKQKEVQNAV